VQEELQVFVENNLDSLLKMDLLAFFHRNPYVIGQTEDIATCLGVNIEELANNLEDLVQSGILKKKTGLSGSSYTLSPSEKIAPLISAFMDFYFTAANGEAEVYRPNTSNPKHNSYVSQRGKATVIKEDSLSPAEAAVNDNWIEQFQPDNSILYTELDLLGDVATWITGEKKVAITIFPGEGYPYCVTKGIKRSTALILAEKGLSLMGNLTRPVLLESHEYPWMKMDVEEEINRAVLAAITQDKSIIGLLAIVNPSPEILQDYRLDALVKLGQQSIQHLKNRAMLQHYQKIALIDELTGLYNYRFFQKRLQEETARAKRCAGTLSLLMIDLDHFKKVNDVLGHQEGNRHLQQVAAVFKKELRETDVICRFGGEEFAVLLPDVDLKGALLAAERLRQAVEDKFTQKRKKPQVTISIGVSNYPKQAGSMEELVKLADLALYRAKESGRNRCCG